MGPRRLTRREIGRSFEALLGVPAEEIQAELPLDVRQGGFDNAAVALTTTGDLVERYLRVTAAAVEAGGAQCDRDSCVEDALAFADRAWRRPLADEESGALRALHDRALLATGDAAEALHWTQEAVLLSPRFLFLAPIVPAEGGTLDAHALAARLAAFLWGQLPDAELRARADAGALLEPETLRTEVERLLGDPRADAFLATFALQWLDLENVHALRFDEGSFPDFDAALLPEMKREAAAFFLAHVRDGAVATDLLSTPPSPTAPSLAAHYGDAPRPGLLGLGAVLTATANPDRTSIPHRGMWVMDNLMCLQPPPAPADVDIGSFTPEPGLTQRERLQQHRADPSCQSCHETMDELGFALERYDATGRYRAEDSGQPIDDRGVLPDGRSFEGVDALAALLRDDPAQPVARCLAENLLAFARGRHLEAPERCHVDAIVEGEPDLPELIARVVLSDAFVQEGAAR